MGQLIDSHCHLHQPWFDDLSNVIKNAKQNNVTKIINCASDPQHYSQVIESSKYDEIFVTIGLQPTLAEQYSNSKIIENTIIQSDKIVGVGEVGLDYYWVTDPKIRELQKRLFIDCIGLANKLELPIITHTRKAESDSLDLLEKHAEVPVLLHSFDGNLKEVKRAMDLGYIISVPTIVTRRKNRRKTAIRAGLDNIILESDSPFCTTSEDIKLNEPKYILDAAKYLSKLFEIDLKEISNITTFNSTKFHKI